MDRRAAIIMALAVAAVVIIAGFAILSASPSKDREALYQVSSLDALVEGRLAGVQPVDDLLRHGDIGVGTFEGLNGEMIVIDGKCYQALADGTVREASGSAAVPFAQVTFFDRDGTTALSGNMSEAIATLSAALASDRVFYVLRIDGTFDSITVRSVPGWEEPYPTLEEATAEQTVFSYSSIKGTLVCIVSPSFTDGMSAAGYHFHFISDDRTKGGHVLAFDISGAEAQWDETPRYVADLPK
ncbi:acetolactate decarboxylase [Methanomassiliicoccus luminyensis]|uniref:acetolactate decarboxylase n=1 Tax=Methanomassiliicoccus luminyensis TaxID=1080712 RepID=UPI000365924E|nr:acetolactate decarboxylase [Methanomassiliicoccus luminyensis]